MVQPPALPQETPPLPCPSTNWRERTRPWWWPALVALGTWLSVVVSIDPAGSYPHCPEGPGLTIDEIFNVQQGVYLIEALRTYHLGLLDPRVLHEVFVEHHLPDHPPLGRVWLGLHHAIVQRCFPPDHPQGPFVVACARWGSATAFALTILLVGGMTSLWLSRWAGLMAALALALMPRAYGHAHLAALESCLGLTSTLAVLAVAHTWAGEAPPAGRTALWTGLCFGLALLTKIQAIFLPIPLAWWAWRRWKWRAARPLALWAGAGLVLFFLGWPWLWFAPAKHLGAYLAGTTERATLSVWYAGTQYTDRTVPRSYALAVFFAVMPVKLLLLGSLGFLGRRPSWRRAGPAEAAPPKLPWTPRESLLFWELVFPLAVFSLPGVPIYDMERLWLPQVMPLCAVFVGRGAEIPLERLQTVWMFRRSRVQAVLLLLMMLQVRALVAIHPCYLSHYGMLVRGVSGAARGGWEVNYWGDAVTRSLLADVAARTPRGATVAVAPVLHQFQVEELWRQSPILRRQGIRLIPYDPEHHPAEFVLLFRRLADLPPDWRNLPRGAERLAEVQREGITLAALYRLPEAGSARTP